MYQELNNNPILKKIDDLQSKIKNLKETKQGYEQRAFQKLKLDWNYHSNAIEGNKLNYGETIAFLMHGVTAKGKPLKDHLDIRGHNDAINFMMDIVKNIDSFSETDIRNIHEMVLVEPYEVDAITPEGLPTKKVIILGNYKKMPNHVKTKTGEVHYYASPEETPIKMTELMDWYKKEREGTLHPLVVAGVFHHRFTAIHPFDDGNGRVARLLLNLMLIQTGYPPLVVKNENKEEYYGVLSEADAGSYESLITFLGENLLHSLEIYYKAALGESIEEPDDLDKEIALLKRELESKKNMIEIVFDNSSKLEIFKNVLGAVIEPLRLEINKFSSMFVQTEYKIFNDDYNGKKVFVDIGVIERNFNVQNIENYIVGYRKDDIISYSLIKYTLDGFKYNIDFPFGLDIYIGFLFGKYVVKMGFFIERTTQSANFLPIDIASMILRHNIIEESVYLKSPLKSEIINNIIRNCSKMALTKIKELKDLKREDFPF